MAEIPLKILRVEARDGYWVATVEIDDEIAERLGLKSAWVERSDEDWLGEEPLQREHKMWPIWVEGHHIQGEDTPTKARMLGVAGGRTFREACARFFGERDDIQLFDPNEMTYWGAGLYEREIDARRAFG